LLLPIVVVIADRYCHCWPLLLIGNVIEPKSLYAAKIIIYIENTIDSPPFFYFLW